jgi:hypothetical protein
VPTTNGRGRSGGRERPRGLGADDLGSIHVVVDDVGVDRGEVGRDGLDCGLVVHVVEDADIDAGSLEARTAGPFDSDRTDTS